MYDYEKELAELKPLYERELSKYEKKISDISSSYKSPLYKEPNKKHHQRTGSIQRRIKRQVFDIIFHYFSGIH